MIRNPLALLLLLLLPAPPVQAGGGSLILGTWLMDTGKHRAHVEITKHDENYDGRITWLEEPTYPDNDSRRMAGKPKVDRDNPDPTIRGRALLGLKILTALLYTGDGQWNSGHIYAPDTGKTYRAHARLTKDGTLKVRGYIGISLLGRTMDWTRPAATPVPEVSTRITTDPSQPHELK